VICVLLFAIIGRSNHAEANDLGGVLQTAWPFLAGCLVGLVASRSWRQPVSLRTGVVVWICTVVGGIALRLASGDTAQLPFVLVATLSLALLLIGWRALLRLVHRARTSHPDGPRSEPAERESARRSNRGVVG
jgi:peptidoglycan/LPS O-acetylase OafA/YrhL